MALLRQPVEAGHPEAHPEPEAAISEVGLGHDELVTFSGSSDDLIEVEGNIHGCDEYNTDDATFVLGGLRIRVFYGDGGCWYVSVGQISEDVTVTARIDSLTAFGYTMILKVWVPKGSHVSMLP